MTEHPNTERPNTSRAATLRRRLGYARTVGLAFVVALPPAINAQNIAGWAHSPNGLGLDNFWSWMVFAGLDVIAAVCVIQTLMQAAQGRPAFAWTMLVWAFAAASAYAGFRHGTQANVGRDVKWFFPFLALSGPSLLHLVVKRFRLDRQLDDGRRVTHAPAGAFGWGRWVPLVGAFTETYCAWRVARLEGIVHPQVAIARYRALRPAAGRWGLRVLSAMRDDSVIPIASPNTAQNVSPNAEPIGEPNTAAEHQPNSTVNVTPNTGQNTTPNTATEQPAERDTERAERVAANVRPITSARRSPNGDSITKNLAAIKKRYRDWRTDMPSVRQCADVVGVATSTGKAYRDRLIAELDKEATG